MILPVPSEAVMPFAGFLWFDHKMSFMMIALVSTFGSIVGSLISYWIGASGGRPLVRKFGKYLLLNEEHLNKTERFFQKYGDKTIFFSRFIPVVRHLISIPAGIGRMGLKKFILYTIIGAAIWNSFLAYLGYLLGSNWGVIRRYSEIIDIIIIIAILAAIWYFIYKLRKNGKIPTDRQPQGQ
ncbi:MAG: DedA family protein [Patescibacteria group bacterium]